MYHTRLRKDYSMSLLGRNWTKIMRRSSFRDRQSATLSIILTYQVIHSVAVSLVSPFVHSPLAPYLPINPFIPFLHPCSDLSPSEMESLKEWESQLREKYDVVGRLLAPGEKPHLYDDDADDDDDDDDEDRKKDT